jgi:hypothetical protein
MGLQKQLVQFHVQISYFGARIPFLTNSESTEKAE